MARQIVVDIIGDADKFNKTLKATSGQATGWGKSVAGAFKVAALAAAAVGAAVVGVGVVVFQAGAAMEAMDAKAQTVFGDSLDMVAKWAKVNAAAMGLTAREVTGLAANLGDLLIPMGFTRDEAAGMSTDIVGLSGALSEWTGGTRSAAEVAVILSKAMLGERDGLKELGISITDADVKARLLKNGTDELTGAALEQAKAMATQELFMEKTTDAQAAYAAGTAVGIRTQAEMTAKFNEAKEVLIEKLYPILVKVTGWLAENLPNAIRVAGDIFNWLGKNVMPTVINVTKAIIAVVQALIPVFDVVFHFLGDAITGAVRAFQGLGTVVSNVFGAIGNIVRGAINGVIGIINSVIGAINGIQVHINVGPVKLNWNGLNLPKIPMLHAGGIVPGAPGSDVLTMLQAGERVTPAGQAGGGVTINFYGPVFGEDAFIDDFTRKIAYRLRTAG